MPEKLPRGWVKATLGEICLPVASIQLEDLPNTEFTYFDIGGIDNEKNRVRDTKVVAGRDAPSRARQALRKGDILFSTVRTYLRKIAIVEQDYPNPVASTGFVVIRAAEGVSPRFLFFQVLSEKFLQPLHALQTGSSYPAVRASDVSAQPIVLPPTREQELIAARLDAALSRLERAEIAARRAQERLKRYRAAVLHAAVTGELTRTWRANHTNNENVNREESTTLRRRVLATRRAKWEGAELQRLRAKGKEPNDLSWNSNYSEPAEPDVRDLPALPKGWLWMSLDQLSFQLTSGSRDWSKYYDRGTGTFLMAQNIRRTGLDLSFRQIVGPPADDKDRTRSQVMKDDILVTIVGANTGDVCIVPRELPEHFVCQSVALIRLAEPVLSRFLWLYLAADEDGQQQWRKMIYGAGRPHLGFEHLRSTVVPIPPLAEQQELVSDVDRRLAAANRLTATLEQQLMRTAETRDSLLREAFSGRLVSQNPADEPASLLLKRIAIAREAELQNLKGGRMSKPKSQKKPTRLRNLLTVLKENGGAMTPEDLFRISGHSEATVDEFFAELRELTWTGPHF